MNRAPLPQAHAVRVIRLPRVGPLRLTASTAGICAIDFSDRQAAAGQSGDGAMRAHLDRCADEMARYDRGEAVAFTVPVDLSAMTPFTRQVLLTLAQVPHGRTVTYRDLAHAVGKPRAARAIGQAMGRNPVPVVLPCHRVLASGGIGGFGGGLEIKRRLLAIEGIVR